MKTLVQMVKEGAVVAGMMAAAAGVFAGSLALAGRLQVRAYDLDSDGKKEYLCRTSALIDALPEPEYFIESASKYGIGCSQKEGISEVYLKTEGGFEDAGMRLEYIPDRIGPVVSLYDQEGETLFRREYPHECSYNGPFNIPHW